MYCVEFFIDDDYKKTAKLICDNYSVPDDYSILCIKTFDYPSFVKRIEYLFLRSKIKSIKCLRKDV